MNIKAIEAKYNIKVKSGDALLSQLNSRMARYEEDSGLSSARMLAKVRKDPTSETEEISAWMQDYMVQKRLAKSQNGTNTVGTHTKTTKHSKTTV